MVGTQIIIIIIHPARVLTSPRFVTTWLFALTLTLTPTDTSLSRKKRVYIVY